MLPTCSHNMRQRELLDHLELVCLLFHKVRTKISGSSCRYNMCLWDNLPKDLRYKFPSTYTCVVFFLCSSHFSFFHVEMQTTLQTHLCLLFLLSLFPLSLGLFLTSFHLSICSPPSSLPLHLLLGRRGGKSTCWIILHYIHNPCATHRHTHLHTHCMCKYSYKTNTMLNNRCSCWRGCTPAGTIHISADTRH